MQIRLSQPLVINPKGHWMSEKLDGVRCYWDGKSLISRTGKTFRPPTWFCNQLPNIALVGELWAGRNGFGQVISAIQKKDSDWKDIKFMVFDIADESMRFEDAQEKLKALKLPAHCELVRQVKCEGRKHLDSFHQTVIDRRGEGCMLRRPRSYYDKDQSINYVKIKKLSTDEAILQDCTRNKNGKLAALVCWYKDKLIKIGTGLSNKLRSNPPVIGTRITFSFEGYTINNIPRFPVFVTVRDYE